MKLLKLLALILTFQFINHTTKAQAISYYPFNSQLSIATNPTKVVWMDFRFQMNSFTASLNTEPALMVNLGYTKNAFIYAGGGVNFGIVASIIDNQDIVKGYFGSVGMRAYPFEKAPKVSVNFELSPYVNYDGTSGVFRAWLGVGYHFGGKK
ncbi:hypothetical protein [Arcicella rosea]|uniref:Outer membrane protein beta-barrel domain-containing protein n=1 Tax=Arcicella rosea TaxID=502909 RepID=A0A841ENW0_9BACT|nr:hypothetical protein [Arcicella rosea]MBB6001970.1 hypothetical protein [Arcicella rosea]